MLNGLDLFSGIGGMSLALRDYVRPVAYCEIDTYCQGVLLNRMAEASISCSPIWDDIKTFPTNEFKGCADIMYGGFPCQDISVAGYGKGLAGERSGLYWEIHRLAKEIIPKFIFLENVPAICTKGGWDVVSSLAEMGYDCRWCVISAASVGALHRRERWFLLANSKIQRFFGRGVEIGNESLLTKPANLCEDVADTLHEGCNKTWKKRDSIQPFAGSNTREWQEAVSSVRRTTDGVPFRVDRIKSLGNAVVPIQAKMAFETLMGLL